ncbi:MAG: molybdate ABC transporter permease subunit [Nitrospirae bacterium]|nr:molybdate ABC transporter permease subunit [Nitrospirota bacterium]
MNETFYDAMRLSIQVSVTATVLVVIAGGVAAYLLAMYRFRGRNLIDMLLTLPLVLPPTVTGYYLVVVFGKNGYIGRYVYELTGWSVMFTWYGAVLASFTVSLPLMVKIARAAIESVDKNLIDASRTLGHTELTTTFRVILPLAGRGITAAVVLSFARAMGEFGATLMVAGNLPGKTATMSLAIYSLSSNGQWPEANLMVVFLTALSGIFLYLANRYGGKLI